METSKTSLNTPLRDASLHPKTLEKPTPKPYNFEQASRKLIWAQIKENAEASTPPSELPPASCKHPSEMTDEEYEEYFSYRSDYWKATAPTVVIKK